jgi:glutamate dehydrogenase/leucine dehydrogenase
MNPFEDSLNRLKALTKYCGTEMCTFLPQDVEMFSAPQRTMIVNFPVTMDDGSMQMFNGYRVQYNNARGPFKGGIRFHPEVDLNEVKALSMWMALKTAVVGIPLGGGKGGVTCNPKDLSKKEIEKISRGFIKEIYGIVGSDRDVPAPDVYTTPEIMGWMLDEFETIVGKKDPGMITGKAIPDGGSEGRDIATAQGGAYVLRDVADEYDLPANATIAIQGFGNAGMTMAKILAKWGYNIVAVSDSRGGIYCEDGIDIDKIIAVKQGSKTVTAAEDPKIKKITNEEMLTLPVDVLVPAALGDQITKKNAEDIKAKVIIELANGPVDSEADEILHKNDVVVVPDILANAGGVTVSYYEWYQNVNNERWTREDVLAKLDKVMKQSFKDVHEIVKALDVSHRTASYILALNRIVEAEKERMD